MIGKSDGERHVQWRPRIRACPPAPVNALLFDGVVVIVCVHGFALAATASLAAPSTFALPVTQGGACTSANRESAEAR